MPRVCIYTAIYGGYDELKPQPQQSIPCDFVCFTDGSIDDPLLQWRLVHLDPRIVETGFPRLKAKIPKVLPHTVFQGLDQASTAGNTQPYDITIWIDASVRILRPEFAQQMIEGLGDNGIAAIKHPERDC